MTVEKVAASPRHAGWRTVAVRLGCIGGALGVVAGVVELAVGPSIRSWVGDKQDTTRLGVVTIVLAAIALRSAYALRTRAAEDPPRRLLLAAGLFLPGLIGFTTVGRLWWIPGSLLVVAGLAAARGLTGHIAAIAPALERNLTRILAAALGALYLGLGMTAHGVAAVAGIAGGLAVIAVASTTARLRPAIAVTALVVAVTPFAALTWWSLVTPLIAALTIVLGTSAVCSVRAEA
jgi:hypothetical protein